MKKPEYRLLKTVADKPTTDKPINSQHQWHAIVLEQDGISFIVDVLRQVDIDVMPVMVFFENVCQDNPSKALKLIQLSNTQAKLANKLLQPDALVPLREVVKDHVDEPVSLGKKIINLLDQIVQLSPPPKTPRELSVCEEFDALVAKSNYKPYKPPVWMRQV